jgi:DNA-directed RNA polymerase subunit RPC12/RpoP
MQKEPVRKYRCASCERTFEHEGKPEKCPFCRCRILILLEGESVRQNSGGGCAPSG